MIVSDNICLFASGATGLGLTHPLDCSAWALKGADGWVLFDTGAGVDVAQVLRRLALCRIEPEQVKAIVLTHAHADHSGGARAISGHFPRAPLYAGALTADILAERDERAISLHTARGRYYPHDYVWTPPAIDEVLVEETVVELAGLSIMSLATPGHSADHYCYLVRGEGVDALVVGDAVFADGKVILQDIADCSVSDTLASIRKLAGVEFSTFLPGHGRFSLTAGKVHIEAAMRFAEAGMPPPQL